MFRAVFAGAASLSFQYGGRPQWQPQLSRRHCIEHKYFAQGNVEMSNARSRLHDDGMKSNLFCLIFSRRS